MGGGRGARRGGTRGVDSRSQYKTDHKELKALARQQQIQSNLETLVDEGAITTRCEPVGVPNHAPIPLLALRLQTPPTQIVSAQVRTITHGTYIDPADAEVRREYVLNQHDPNENAPATPPPGFTATRTSRDWLIYKRCGSSGPCTPVEVPPRAPESPPATPDRELPLRLPGIA